MSDDVIIRPCTVAEIEQSASFPALIAAYAQESSIPELGEVSADMDTYRDFEARGAMYAIGAFAPELVGVATVLIYGLPHYAGRRIASMESLFVLPSARRNGTGMRLLQAAKDLARDFGAPGLLVSAPVGSRLDKVLQRTADCRETNHIFLMGLK